jgi:hypothetical protein
LIATSLPTSPGLQIFSPESLMTSTTSMQHFRCFGAQRRTSLTTRVSNR